MYGYTVHVKRFGCRGIIPLPDTSRRALPEKVVGGGGRAAQGKFGVRANADIPRDAKVARKFGAEAIRNNGFLDRPVLDKTGLPGTYDFKIESTPEFRINHNPELGDISVFTAVASCFNAFAGGSPPRNT